MASDIFLYLYKWRGKRNFIKHGLLFLIYLASCFSVAACNAVSADAFPRREVSVYVEKTITAASQYRLDIECDFGNLEFFKWDRQEVKFELYHKVRAGKPEAELKKMLESFNVSASEKEGKVSFACRYKGRDGNYKDTFTVVRIFMPDKPVSVECKLQEGKLSFLDDMESSLRLDVGDADVVINKLRGYVNYKGNSGNFRISSGLIATESSIKTTNGNITVKSDFEMPGLYTIHTGAGIISLDLPETLDAVFESNGRVDVEDSSNAVVYSKFLINCGLGKVSINRF